MAGVILAGGRSRRLGIDKTTMAWPPRHGTQTTIPASDVSHQAVRADEVPGSLSVAADAMASSGLASALFEADERLAGKHVGDRPATLLEATAAKLREVCDEVLVVGYRAERPLPGWVRSVPDQYADGGSLAGIYSGLAAADGAYALVVATDMPFLSLPLLRWMRHQTRDYDVLVPVREQLEPLHAIYNSATCLDPMRRRLEAGRLRITGFFEDVRVRYVDPEVLRQFDPEALSFFNVNTPDDLAKAAAIAAREALA